MVQSSDQNIPTIDDNIAAFGKIHENGRVDRGRKKSPTSELGTYNSRHANEDAREYFEHEITDILPLQKIYYPSTMEERFGSFPPLNRYSQLLENYY